MNLIITGEVQSGKTKWCREYCQWLVERNYKVGGFLCPEARNHDTKVGYDIVDVRTGQSVVFGRFAAQADFPGELVGAYQISHEGLDFANRAIQKALENKCDMVFIDEVGHLELAGKGISEAAKMAIQKVPNATIVVRKPLLAAFFKYFHPEDSLAEFSIKDLELDTSYPLP